ncbi:hypothetical protein B9Z55_015437 [Caenorhabditis nigoni]|uniref:Uncharacterized protein n=2 Tax=Caenorhabditis nigoni TaxID=1611254 RepID=A0A2G5UAS9_9PELO|nr:hypothetical protein B9Z55_015437 [Caenorhabditis nigoni]
MGEMMRNGEPTKWIVWDSQEDFEAFEDVVSHVAAVFLQNSVSRNFGQDIFQCVKLLSRERDVKFSHVKKRMESWGNFSTRIYSFCAQCSSILSCSKTCVNNQCLRYGKSQANVASLKTVITYSIRQQVEEMFKNDVFDSSILTRSSRIPSINERLCDTPKYKERMPPKKTGNFRTTGQYRKSERRSVRFKKGNQIETDSETSPERNQKPIMRIKEECVDSTPKTYLTLSECQKKYPELKPYDDYNDFKPEGRKKRKIQDAHEYDEMEEEENEESDIEDEIDEDEEDNSTDDAPSSSRKNVKSKFSISKFLRRNNQEKTSMESLKDAVKDGNVLRMGSTIRKGFDDQSISDLQLEELARVSPKPTISLFQFHKQLENASSPEKKDIMMGQMFLTKMAMSDDKSIQKLKASVSSLSHNFAEQTKIGILTKRTLEGVHVIEPIDEFPRIDIMHIYYKHSLIGDCAFSQMTNFLTRVFKNALNPPFHIWNYSFRPKCVRSTDKHFQLLPEQVSDTLLDFSYDVVGVFLPDHLLYGKINENERNYLREYHYCLESGKLLNCKKRSTCSSHLTWRDMKSFRDYCRENSKDPDDYDPKDIVGFSKNHSKNNPSSYNGPPILPKSS